MIIHMNRRGFTIVEIIIVISIMGILITLGVVNLRSSQANGRDSERKTDIETIAQHLETYYTGGNDTSTTRADCTGGNISHDGLYTVHKFTESGTLTCSTNLTAEILVVGGGGGGGGSVYQGGGGGGGGIVYNSSYNVTANGYFVTVGEGGASSAIGTETQSNGQNSVFGDMTAYGGGRGGSENIARSNGGSGGGPSHNADQSASSATQGVNGTARYGNGGGLNDAGNGLFSASGGGGAGAASATTIESDAIPGAGGSGLMFNISGSSDYYGGGGGGSNRSSAIASGGIGGGGATGIAGTQNTGGGGGAGTFYAPARIGGAGGSGIVIVRYLTPIGIGTYPSTDIASIPVPITEDSVRAYLRDIDVKSFIAPGISSPATTFIPATCSGVCTQTTAGVTPQPTYDQYVYQPIHSDGTLCNDGYECRKFNLFYKLETDNIVYMVTSVNQ